MTDDLKLLRENFKPLFQPRSVAVIGASNNKNKWGHLSFKSLMDNFPGKLYAVNRRDPEILGNKAYEKITDIPGPVDLVVIVVPPKNVAGVMEDCVRHDVRAAVIITAGFAEVGPEGKKMQDKVLDIARKGGIRLVGPNCMGMWSASGKLPAFMFPMDISDGPLALISQGGNIGGAMVADATTRGVGFRYYVSCGCTADIQIEDYIEYMGHDDTVKVIMVYVEGLSLHNRFIEKVSKVTLKKPVIILKPGRTEAAAKAILSHSGSLAGLDKLYDAAFKKAGVVRVDTTTELLDVGIAFLTQPLPKGRNVVITTPGGSYGVMCAEACALLGLNVIELPQQAMDTFNTMFPSRWSHGNPVDPAGDRDFVQYMRAPEVLMKCSEVDALIFMGFGSFSGLSTVFSGNSDRSQFIPLNNFTGFKNTVSEVIEIIVSGNRDKIRDFVRQLIQKVFDAIMPTQALEMGEFLDTVSEFLTTDEMVSSPFLKNVYNMFASDDKDQTPRITMANLAYIMESIISSLIHGLAFKYGKPIITTTFTEQNTTLREDKHFPYPNSDRASNVLCKLVEYSEFFDRKPHGG